MFKDYFNNLVSQCASFFTNVTNLNRTDLKEIRQLVEQVLSDFLTPVLTVNSTG